MAVAFRPDITYSGGMAAKVIPDSTVDQLIRRGLTPKQVSDYLREHENVDVLPEAINMWCLRRGIQLNLKPRYDDLIPWIVAAEHSNKYAPKYLRFYARRRAGQKLSAEINRKLDNWLAKMERDNTVIHYDRDLEPYWHYVPRRPGIDLGLIREPGYEIGD